MNPRAAFIETGRESAAALGNRGPICFRADGSFDTSFLDAYWREGFYVFENVIDVAEIDELVTAFFDLLERVPIGPDAHVDRHGRTAIGQGLERGCFRFAAPLSDPYGGTDATSGRYQARMDSVGRPEGAPESVLLHVTGVMQLMDEALRAYGHPKLLAVAEAINGPDFTPFTGGIWVKPARLGAAVAWHQDGTTHWQDPALDVGTHGFNFSINLFGTNAVNALWVVPRTHAEKHDIKAMVATNGSDRLSGAVPILTKPGDVAICNRQVVHGSFANTSDRSRATLNFGFHRRASVLGVKGWATQPFDEAHIEKRSRVVQLAIGARRQRFPDEAPYQYQPFSGSAPLELNDDTRQTILRNYNVLDIGI